MYKVSVPVTSKTLELYGREKYSALLKEIGADRVFICPASNTAFWNNYGRELALLKTNIDFLKSEGFEVGVWVWAFQYSGGDFTYVKSPSGKDSETSVCPTDENYRRLMGGFIEDAASLGIDYFMFDDDYRYSFIDNGFGCVCENHLKLISEELKESVTLEKIKPYLLSGGKNKYRDAFVKMNGKALVDFALEMRKRLDNINPNVRMGFCSCIGSWNMDGVHPDKIAEALAGNTKPFYRLIGAPYWAARDCWGNRLGNIIEQERLEASERRNSEIEIFSEGDAYPRPRFHTPAALIEGFDTALRAAGCLDGILKYIVDYTAEPGYETGYLLRHKRNKSLYENIDRLFADKENIGIRVYDKEKKYEDMTIPERFANKNELQNFSFNYSSRLLVGCSLPSVFNGNNYSGVAFGEDIKAVPNEDYSKGLIIDLAAARILKENGVDTGVEAIGEEINPDCEIFDGNRRVGLGISPFARRVTVSKNAKTESRFSFGEETGVASFRYENSKGQRFLVFCFDAYLCEDDFFRQYTRAEQIINAVPWLCGKQLPAVIKGNPDLYVQLKENGEACAMGLWNFCPDDIPEPIIELSFVSPGIEAVNCTARAEGNKIRLSRIEPFGCAFLKILKGETNE